MFKLLFLLLTTLAVTSSLVFLRLREGNPSSPPLHFGFELTFAKILAALSRKRRRVCHEFGIDLMTRTINVVVPWVGGGRGRGGEGVHYMKRFGRGESEEVPHLKFGFGRPGRRFAARREHQELGIDLTKTRSPCTGMCRVMSRHPNETRGKPRGSRRRTSLLEESGGGSLRTESNSGSSAQSSKGAPAYS